VVASVVVSAGGGVDGGDGGGGRSFRTLQGGRDLVAVVSAGELAELEARRGERKDAQAGERAARQAHQGEPCASPRPLALGW
jgi:hypothetical protein